MIENKNILIIGASSGIGLALAEQLAPHNKVFIASRSGDAVQHLDIQHISYDATQDDLDTSQLPENYTDLFTVQGVLI